MMSSTDATKRFWAICLAVAATACSLEPLSVPESAASGGGGAGGEGDGASVSIESSPVCEDVGTIAVQQDPPMWLSQTGLYADIASATLAEHVHPYTPVYQLWSDTAVKRRFLYLPQSTSPACQIDTSDMDHWELPVGTQVFKEFSLGGVLLETRLIERFGPGPSDFWMGAFVWSADASDAMVALWSTPR